MLSLEAHAVLFELLESLALTFTHMICTSLSGIHLDEGLKAEFNSDGHGVAVIITVGLATRTDRTFRLVETGLGLYDEERSQVR